VNDTAPRLAPLPRERWRDDERDALAAAFPEAAARFLDGGADTAPVPNVLATLLHHPALAGPFLAYNRVLLEQPTLGHRWRELLILRVAWRTRAAYEWAQHVRLAAKAGITREEIDAIGRGAASAPWAPVEADLLAAADQLVDDHVVDDETWTRLAGHLDERQLVEVVFVVGTYAGLAMAFNSFGLQLDPELEASTTPLPGPEE
jgi:alkylhydroperoxidase family enzyme